MTHTSVVLLSPIARTGPAGTWACSPGSPSHHPVIPFPGSRPRWPTRDVDGDNVGLDGTGLVPLLLLHGGQGEGPGPGRLLVGGGGEAQGGVGWPHAQRGGTAALLIGGSPARGLQGKACVWPNPPHGGRGGDRKGHLGSCCPISRANPFSPPDAGAAPPCPTAPGNAWARGGPGTGGPQDSP